MSELKYKLSLSKSDNISAIALIVACLALIATLFGLRTGEHSSSKDAVASHASGLQAIKNDNVLRVGYGVWPPFSIIDPKESDQASQVKGFSVDLVNEIASRAIPPLRIEWHRFNWDTMKADISTEKFDFVCEPVFQTIPRAIDFGLSRPYASFGIGAAVVRKDDNRFTHFSDLNHDDITIALAEGWTTSEFARAHLPKAKFISVTVRENIAVQMDNVITGRADVALNDVPSVVNYVAAHPDQVKALWVSDPPSFVVGGFATRPEDAELLRFLNACLDVLSADGTIKRLDEKWKTTGYFEESALRPGAGISNQ